jgi:hypothetical protein
VRPPKKIPSDKLVAYVEAHPDAFLRDSARIFVQHRACAQGLTAQWYHVKKKIPYYKERNEDARHRYKETIEATPEETIIYIDETGIDASLHRDKCRAKRGEKVYGGVLGSVPI